ncbi:MAG: hypothetical protein COY42_01740 [Armatimonadetes bacterium CG_4_10_14_0_8_um_filter_66_14]|nr:hypothetical protein [Armatimonadota bacterium]OIO97200.1 MAG: hypothetical protein AUJ96_23655 [Armatimonadetes bacterium CG2_30_66_41]PIZ50348.1 MAG: hypothetical protein COY42_01740 [Armatimonadetes bacterium CG_4_10_14_0_8_um_filter_66_14]
MLAKSPHGMQAAAILTVLASSLPRVCCQSQTPGDAREVTASGVRSLQKLLEAYGVAAPPGALPSALRRHQTKGMSLAELAEVGARCGLELEGWSMAPEELTMRNVPALFHTRKDGGHFSLFVDSRDGVIRWLDAGVMMRVVRLDAFAEEFSGFCLLPKTDTRPAAPGLWFRQLHHDAGQVELKEVSQVFACQNRGTGLVRIQVQSCSPGGRASMIGSRLVGPGERTRVQLSGEVAQLGGVHAAAVVTDDPANPVQYLTLSYRKLLPVVARPDRLRLANEQTEASCRPLWVHGCADLDFTRLTTTNPALSVTRVRRRDRRTHFAAVLAIEVCTRPVAPGVYGGEVVIETNDAETPRLVVPTEVQIKGRVRAAPEVLYFGFVPPRTQREMAITIHAVQFLGFRVTGCVAKVPGFRVASVQAVAQESFRLTLVMLPSPPGTFVAGVVSVLTNVPGEEQVDIPVIAYVKE